MGISRDHLEEEDARVLSSVARMAQLTLETQGCIMSEEPLEWARTMKGYLTSSRGLSGFLLSVVGREVFWSKGCTRVVRDDVSTGAQVRCGACREWWHDGLLRCFGAAAAEPPPPNGPNGLLSTAQLVCTPTPYKHTERKDFVRVALFLWWLYIRASCYSPGFSLESHKRKIFLCSHRRTSKAA